MLPEPRCKIGKIAGIKAQIGYKRHPGQYSGKPSLIVYNTLDRQFDVYAPDRFWVTDITYIKTMEGLADTADLQDQLAFHRIRLFTPSIGEITTIHVTVMGMMAQMALKDLGEKTKRGQMGRVLKGRIPAGILKGWCRIFQTTNAMVRNLIDKAESDDEFKEVLNDIAEERGDINRRKLGWWIKRNEGCIVNGFRLTRASGAGNSSAWRVERVE